MKVLSTSPRVLDITNFFSKEESDNLVNSALQQTDEVFGFHRSTTGTSGASVFDKRTSENAWDTTGAVALAVKRYVGRHMLRIDASHLYTLLFPVAAFSCWVLMNIKNRCQMDSKSFGTT